MACGLRTAPSKDGGGGVSAGRLRLRAGPTADREDGGAARAVEGGGGGDGGARQRELERMAEVLVTSERLR